MKLNNKAKFFYGMGNLGYGTVAQTVNNFIMFFGTSVLGIKGTLVGLAIALSTFWDGISDPIVGFMSDHTRNKRFGKRLPFMIWGTVGMIIFNFLLWSIPIDLSEGAKFVWILVCLICLETFCTAFSTPYVALGVDMVPEYNEQSKLQGFKTVFFILGMILPTVLMFILMPEGQGQFQQSGYQNIAYASSLICLISGLICILGVKKYATKINSLHMVKKESFVKSFFKIFYTFFLVLKKENFSAIIIGYSVALISTAFLSSVGLHLFTYSFHFSSTQIACLMGMLFVAAIFSQPVWIMLSKRYDKKFGLKISLLLVFVGILLTAIVFGIRMYFMSSVVFVLIMICLFICGFGTGALYTLPISMYADCITLEKEKTGENNAGIYSGFMTLAYNISNSLALLIVGILLDLIKFNAGQPVQPLVVQNGLGIIVFVGCGISILSAYFIFNGYKIRRSDIIKKKMLSKNVIE